VTGSTHGKCEVYLNILHQKKCIDDVNLRVDGRILLKYVCKKNVMALVRSS